ncbi:single-stranded DNA-binding protein [uncultured phage_MedDCM-OCT-S30-C28]|uniref:Single-stranded DNA-binding protein n=1 Tax=uncultured phage_MedDCM-OCT-S30-C28 TaxID=2741076 RepID=A0A6S4PLX5_9CAUD|nr:single-stranded DNA-binding protein [uncultured phage_MedDCM-OCT-S30-C28]BAQ94244.1 single-stranded DNA-binding protein [uncultured phage_MedDCM-OCT-S30-C28]
MNDATNISELGEAIYPHLNRPDVKFNENGEYKVNLKIPEDKAKGMIAIYEKAIQDSISEAEAKLNGKKVKLAPKPYSIENGQAVFKYKMKATGINRKTKEPFSQRPALFDAKKNPLNPSSCNIWGGSKMKIAYVLRSYYSPALGAGVTAQLKAVQIIELVEGKQMDLFAKEDGYENTTSPEEMNNVPKTEVQTSTDF